MSDDGSLPKMKTRWYNSLHQPTNLLFLCIKWKRKTRYLLSSSKSCELLRCLSIFFGSCLWLPKWFSKFQLVKAWPRNTFHQKISRPAKEREPEGIWPFFDQLGLDLSCESDFCKWTRKKHGNDMKTDISIHNWSPPPIHDIHGRQGVFRALVVAWKNVWKTEVPPCYDHIALSSYNLLVVLVRLVG